MDSRRKFLANLIADLGKISIGAGGINQIFSDSQNGFEIIAVSATALILFTVAFFIHPKGDD